MSNILKISASFFGGGAMILTLNVATTVYAQSPPPPSAATPAPAGTTPFTVQIPPAQTVLPTGALSPQSASQSGSPGTSQGTSQSPPQSPLQNPPQSPAGSTQLPATYVPMALPPSSGGFNPNGQNPNAVIPNSYSPQFTPQQPAVPTKSEIVKYDPKPELKSVLLVKTSEGEFKITLKADIAPRNVENFIDLALGQKEFVDVRTGKKVRRPFYTGLNCHRVLKSVLIQCGCPFGNGTGGPGFRVNDERSTAMRFDRPGVVAMALSRIPNDNGLGYDANSAGSQFFITLAPLPDYNGQFTVIGQVTSGMDTIRKIAQTPTGPTDRPLKRVVIFSIDPDLPATAPAPTMDPMTTPITAPVTTSPSAPAPAAPTGGTVVDPFAAP